jgi:hypothetical protein
VVAAHLVEMVDTLDLKFNSGRSSGSTPLVGIVTITSMVELVDTLDLGPRFWGFESPSR